MPDYVSLVEDLLKPGGKMEEHIPGYVFRSEQQRMALEVARVLADDLFLAAEAGTGVGKTYAYLVPALLWAYYEQVRVVVATKTKALQEQIVDRDLPALRAVLGFDFNYVEAKGRDNYVCWNKYQRILAGKKHLQPGEAAFLEKILTWVENTSSGDKKELAINQELLRYWPVIAADRHYCQRDQCMYRDKCFHLQMIKKMKKAHLIVTNHALLLSDLMVDNRILPEYKYLIIDEAHNFGKEMFDHLACRLARIEIQKLLESLSSHAPRGKRSLVFQLRQSYPHLLGMTTETEIIVDRLGRLTTEAFWSLTPAGSGTDSSSSRVLGEDDLEKDWYINAQSLLSQEWKPNWERLMVVVAELAQELEELPEADELLGILASLRIVDESAFAIIERGFYVEDSLTWLEFEEAPLKYGPGQPTLEAGPPGKQVAAWCAARIDNWDRIGGMLYEKLDSLIMVSATLTIENDFGNFIHRNGLADFVSTEKMTTFIEHSPFDYEQQAALFMVNDIPAPNSRDFFAEVVAVLKEVITQQGGRTMVLFTSRQQLHDAAQLLRPLCLEHGLSLLVQHQDGEFTSLIREFTSRDNCILMGVETFWEGIDLKGEVLKCLVIVRLPFRSPADPYCNAWDKYLKRQGRNSFKYFMLPDAVIRFKQGVGRLIRSEEDRGAVVVLDNRIENTRYGQAFLKSIPIKNQLSISRSDLVEKLQSWSGGTDE